MSYGGHRGGARGSTFGARAPPEDSFARVFGREPLHLRLGQRATLPTIPLPATASSQLNRTFPSDSLNTTLPNDTFTSSVRSNTFASTVPGRRSTAPFSGSLSARSLDGASATLDSSGLGRKTRDGPAIRALPAELDGHNFADTIQYVNPSGYRARLLKGLAQDAGPVLPKAPTPRTISDAGAPTCPPGSAPEKRAAPKHARLAPAEALVRVLDEPAPAKSPLGGTVPRRRGW